MLDATETLILVGIFALAALLIVVPRLLSRRSTSTPDTAPHTDTPGDPDAE
jgi:hypothetical protein